MIRRDYFIFDGIESHRYGIYLAGPATADAPQRDVTATQVPGRSGDLLLDNGRFLNQELHYQCAVVQEFETRFAAIKTEILQRQGYCRLEDTIHPEEYRLACFAGPVEAQTTPYNRAGQFELRFNCKPQRFLKRGERAIRLTQSGAVLRNPGMPALPLFRVEGGGAGTLRVNGTEVEFLEDFSGPVLLDCDTQDAWFGAGNKNNEIRAPEYPALAPGENRIEWSGGVTAVTVTPRWWTL